MLCFAQQQDYIECVPELQNMKLEISIDFSFVCTFFAGMLLLPNP